MLNSQTTNLQNNIIIIIYRGWVVIDKHKNYFCLLGSTVLKTLAYVSIARTHMHIDLHAWKKKQY